jgi:hypothetical protein
VHDLGGENPYIDTKDILKLLNCGRLGRQAAGHPWSALCWIEQVLGMILCHCHDV